MADGKRKETEANALASAQRPPQHAPPESPAANQHVSKRTKTADPQPLSWTDLPHDLWTMVVGILSEWEHLRGPAELRGIMRLRLVSRGVKQAVDEGLKALGPSHALHEIINTSLLSTLVHRFTGLERLHLRFCNAIRNESLERLSQLHRLTHLNLAGTNVKGCGIRHLAGLTKLQRLMLQYLHITDDDLVWLNGLMSLTALDLFSNKLTDGGLVHLQGLTGLRELNLGCNRKLRDPLRHMSTMKKLEMLDLYELEGIGPTLHQLSNHPALTWLSLRHTGTSDEDLARCVPSLAKLHHLELDMCEKITNRGVAHLANATKMRSLHLEATRIGDNGLFFISGMTELEELSLNKTKVTGTGLAHLQNCPRLRTISLNVLRLSLNCIECIAKLRGLKELDLSYSDVTDEGLMRLTGMKDLRVYVAFTAVTGSQCDFITMGEWLSQRAV